MNLNRLIISLLVFLSVFSSLNFLFILEKYNKLYDVSVELSELLPEVAIASFKSGYIMGNEDGAIGLNLENSRLNEFKIILMDRKDS